MKVCKWCKKDQPFSSFYIGKKWASENKCKDCYKKYWANWTSNHIEYYIKKRKDRYNNDENFRNYISNYYIDWYKRNGRTRSDIVVEATLQWKENHPKEIRAQHKLRRAVSEGIIKKPNDCTICHRITRLNAHHENYDKPLDVIWLCASCHKKLHTYHSISL